MIIYEAESEGYGRYTTLDKYSNRPGIPLSMQDSVNKFITVFTCTRLLLHKPPNRVTRYARRNTVWYSQKHVLESNSCCDFRTCFFEGSVTDCFSNVRRVLSPCVEVSEQKRAVV